MAAAKRILLVDAAGPPRTAMAEQLAGLGYDVESEDSGAAALATAGGRDLLLIAGPPLDMTEAALCQAWRGARGGAVLALVADRASAAGLIPLGAAVLVRPVRLADLARAIAAATRAGAPPPVALGAARFHPATRDFETGAGRTVRLTEKEAAILAYLHRSAGRAVPRDELLGQVWGYADAITTHTLETHVYRLRRKLSVDAAGAPAVVSEAGGYRLVIPA